MLNKEVKQNPAVLAMLGSTTEEKAESKSKDKKKDKKLNPSSYKRNRGKGGTKPMSYYLPSELITALNVQAAKSGKTKSDIVVVALCKELGISLKEVQSNAAPQ